jgi:acyl-CoA synthetase (AMP-forming)/AMP-acid ligase II
VKRDAEGFLYFIGRNDEMIKTSGYRVSPGEIEEVAFQIDGVEQAVAFGAPDRQIGSGIVLVIQTALATLDAATVMAHCRMHLPMFMLPGHIEIVGTMPRNPNGKIDRKALSVQFHEIFAEV